MLGNIIIIGIIVVVITFAIYLVMTRSKTEIESNKEIMKDKIDQARDKLRVAAEELDHKLAQRFSNIELRLDSIEEFCDGLSLALDESGIVKLPAGDILNLEKTLYKDPLV
jgi:hypothetical protein